MTLTTILLAGGRSRRMGVDKATVPIAGEPLWQRQLRLLREMRPDALQVSAQTPPPWCPPDIEVVLDTPPSRGPLSGIAAALRQLQTSHLLVLAIDLPRMTPEHLQKLWSLARPGIGVLPRQRDYFEVLCAIYPAEAITSFEDTLNCTDWSLQPLARKLISQSRLQIYSLRDEEQKFHFNMNMPADLFLNGRACD